MSVTLKCLLLQLACVAIASGNPYRGPTQNITVITRVVTIPTGYVYYPNIHAAWKLHTEKAPWSNAYNACVADGGRLAIVDTRAKVGYIKTMTSRNFAVWVGIKKRSKKWTTAGTTVKPTVGIRPALRYRRLRRGTTKRQRTIQ